MKNEWFASWFDSPYYHLLYKNHDEDKAQDEIDQLLQALHPAPGARVLDLACGRGRHARHLADLGFEVTGLDISTSSINYARQFEHDHLAFYQHDMRRPFRSQYFDLVVNFFTSFGYFDRDKDNLLSLKNIFVNLREGGVFLLDYFNAEWVRQHLVQQEEKTIDGINFRLSRYIEQDYVHKAIEFEAEGQPFHFHERVRLFTQAEFEALFQAAGLRIRQTFGDYALQPFEAAASKRLILIAEKPLGA